MADPVPLPARRPLFVAVIFAGSFLLFLIQPMVARLALPRLGGAPNVWNSAMVVFQTLLLGGYLYAHLLARMSLPRQAAIHLALLALSALTLPIALAKLPPPAQGWEVLWAPALFLLTIGPVFFTLSAQSSLMQRWFAAAPEAGDPYSLYGASNLGSFAGLLAYPFLLEPLLPLQAQSGLWTGGYLLLILLVALAAASRLKSGGAATAEHAWLAAGQRPGTRDVLLWLALAAVPSGLMLSTTTLLTTDIMAMPLLWIIPLGLYLVSFTFAFSERGAMAAVLTRYAPVTLLFISSLAMASGGQSNVVAAYAMVGLLFVLSVALHARLYATRPDPRHLTYFYFVIAAGGALGGTFTALLAPVLFDWIYEHAILLLAAALLLRQRPFIAAFGSYLARAGRRRHALAAGAVLLAALLALALWDAAAANRGLEKLALVCAMSFIGIAVIGVRWAFAAIVALIMLGNTGIATLESSFEGKRDRSYFGVYSVEEVAGGRMRQLSHGTTIHGSQWLDPARRREPTSYYGHSAGIGIALDHAEPDASIGIVGLGAGTLACYRKPRQDWTFFEIDARILRYSRDGTFTFLADCAPHAKVVIGDARLELAKQPAKRFDILAIDAFSSDSIPLHLLTEEAFEIYGAALDPEGLLLVHVSNRFFDLRPMMSALAAAGGWHAAQRFDSEELAEGTSPSLWIAFARSEERLSRLEQSGDYPWRSLPPPNLRAWTDDNSSILPLVGW